MLSVKAFLRRSYPFLTHFKSKLIGGGVRPNFFEVEINFPGLAIDTNDVSDKIRFLFAFVIEAIFIIYI